MREIKFRAWYENRIIEVAQIDFFVDGFVHVNEELVGAILMQFTGLKDKKGKDIYEGDIIALDSWNPKNHQIVFIEGAFCLGDRNGNYDGDIHYIHHAGIEQATVVGNIYEDRHLLHE